jgi:putative molybdopterin biosynthesis protein
MEDSPLYQQIVDTIRKEILAGNLKPGDRLPPMRQMTGQWHCTTGTILRAYQELARLGLVTSRVGQGTRVAENISPREQAPLRREILLNRAEAFLLESMTSGYSPDEVDQVMRMVLDRWRAYTPEPTRPPPNVLRFVGSHDPAIALIASHYHLASPDYTLQLAFAGSLGGLIALAEQSADLAGCHLWDEETDTYNVPFVRRLLPGHSAALLTLAHRRIGLIVPPGNPRNLTSLPDIAQQGIRFVNRQPGSGTRVWLDAQIRRLGITPTEITGYNDEKTVHSEVARAIVRGHADVGLGVQAAALAFGLDFVLLTTERYDLVIPIEKWELPSMQALIRWIESSQARAAINNLGGYDTSQTGRTIWVN